jgi:biopolymer transport protein ExbB
LQRRPQEKDLNQHEKDFLIMDLTRILHKHLGLVGAVVVMLALPQFAHADDWAHKKKLGFDTTASGAEIKEDVAQLPLLVRLHSGNFTFSEAKLDGSDLRFFAADSKTPLKYHIENFDATNELANVWVALPRLSANSDKDSLMVEWGNPNATAAGDSKDTYDAAQIFVYHFGGAEGAGTQVVRDATGNANHAKASSAKAVSSGPIGSAAGFDGSSKIDLSASPSLKLGSASGFTFSAWIKPAGNDNATLYSQLDGIKTLKIGLANGALFVSNVASIASTTSALKLGVWQHIAVVAGSGKVAFYIDGNEAGSGALILPDMAGEAVIGEGLKGELDEVSLAGTVRTAGYIKALASSQSADTPMLSFVDGEGGGEGEGISYVSILLGAVTIDGWVVIGLLMVMAVISFYVMITKTLMLSATGKANNIFLDVFKDKPSELLTPGHEETAKLSADARLKSSSIYHLYSIGLREVTHRFDAQIRAGVPNNLSAAGLDAIRAALEASMVRENQRLNSGMVLLTIAISGGPFLGLLGTVVGVMITFAAIAAAGDVNVNAIAPGIAAALVATVAGLAVAIPALFGYNWLASKIKNVSADTQVFADEFLTKSAEMHST